MEKVIRRRFGLLLALTLPIWSVQGEQAPTDDLPDFNVVPENAARAVLLHAATPECDTVRSCLSIGPFSRGLGVTTRFCSPATNTPTKLRPSSRRRGHR